METTALLIEVNNDYARTMNKIIFDRFLEDNSNEMSNRDLFPVPLALPNINVEKEVPEMGMMELERTKGAKEMYIMNIKEINFAEPKDFTDVFKDFCFASLYIK